MTSQAAPARALHHPIAEAENRSLWADAEPQQAERFVALRGGDGHGYPFAVLGSAAIGVE
jgi:hypothetical protein